MYSVALFSSFLAITAAWKMKTIAPSGSPLELSTRGSYNPTGIPSYAPSGSSFDFSTRGSYNPTGIPSGQPNTYRPSYAPSGSPIEHFTRGNYYPTGAPSPSGSSIQISTRGSYNPSGVPFNLSTRGYDPTQRYTARASGAPLYSVQPSYSRQPNTQGYGFTGRPSRPILYPTQGYPTGGPMNTFAPLKPKIPLSIEQAIRRMKAVSAH